jgi:hypothetical protein
VQELVLLGLVLVQLLPELVPLRERFFQRRLGPLRALLRIGRAVRGQSSSAIRLARCR